MAYRDQVALLEHRLAQAEKRATRAEASTPSRRRVVWLVSVVVISAGTAAVGYALAPSRVEVPVILEGHNESTGPLRSSTWRVSRDESECSLVADDYEPRHQADLPRRLVLRVYCGEELVYETPQLRYGERHIGGCISQTGRSHLDYRLFCSERVVDRGGAQRGPALSADSVGGILQLTSEAGEVQEWRLEPRPWVRERHPGTRVSERLHPALTLRAEASIREIEGSPLVHGIELPQITGRSTCEVRVRSAPSLGLDTQCELSVVCDGIPLYTDEGYCHHRAGSLQSFADYEATWSSHHREGRRTPVAVYDASLGIVRLADQDRTRGFAMTLELRRPVASVAGILLAPQAASLTRAR